MQSALVESVTGNTSVATGSSRQRQPWWKKRRDPARERTTPEITMPPRTKRPCRHTGCAALTNDRSGYCDQHREQHAGDGWQRHTGGKSRHERGYGRQWDIRRPRILQRDNYVCQACKRKGIGTVATHVDHIIPKAHGGTDADDNLESLCATCHRAKTATERFRR